MGLSDRELASLAWLGMAAIGIVLWRPTRTIPFDLAKTLLKRVFLVPFVLFALWMAAIVGLASLTPAWDLNLLKATLIWFITVGAVLLFDATKAAQEPGWFLRRAKRTTKATVFLEFYLNAHTLTFLGEFTLQAWLLILVIAAVASPSEASTTNRRSRTTWVTWAQAATGLALLSYVGIWVVGNWQNIDPGQSVRELALPIWLVLFALPAMFIWSWYLTWDGARSQLRRVSPGERSGWRSRLAVLLGYNVHISDMRLFANDWAREVVEAPSLRAALRVIGEHRARLKKEEAEKRRAAEDLVRYAGVQGTNAEGRQLDRREFSATVDALEWLAACQSGAYQAHGRYDRDQLKIFQLGMNRGLPEEHGITMKVRNDGQAWRAWRRTITGWVFAAGATGPAPDQWFFDGPEPPKSYPGSDGWPSSPFEQGSNWEAS